MFSVENLNCNYADQNEFQSLEVALQLQAEELSRVQIVTEGEDYMENEPNV